MSCRNPFAIFLSAVLIANTVVPAFARTEPGRTRVAVGLKAPAPVKITHWTHERGVVALKETGVVAESATMTEIANPYKPFAVFHGLSTNVAEQEVGGTGEVSVNMKSGAVMWNPFAGMSIPNFTGPSVDMSPSFCDGSQPIDNGFGPRFTHPWNYGFELSNAPPVGELPAYARYFNLVLPNGSKVFFENLSSQVPVEGIPVVLGPSPTNGGWAKAYETAVWGVQSGAQYILLVNKDKSEMRFDYSYANEPGFHNLTGFKVFRPTKITDKVGNYITLEYAPEQRPVQVYQVEGGDPVHSDYWHDIDVTTRNLKVIKDSAGNPLLTMGTDGQGNYTNSVDNFGRKVIYTVVRHDLTHHAEYVYGTSYELTSISQIGLASASTLPTLKEVVYSDKANPDTGLTYRVVSQFKSLNAAGGMSTTNVHYDSAGRADYIDDANDNRVELVYGTSSTTAKNWSVPNGSNVRTEELRSSVAFDDYGQITAVLDSSNNAVAAFTYNTTNAPYKVATSQDAYGHIWSNEYDSNGNLKWSDTPRKERTLINDGNGGARVVKISTYNVTNPASPVLLTTPTQIQYTFATNDPENLIKWIKTPIPGEVNTGNTQTTTLSYRSTALSGPKGVLLSVETPGNNAEAYHTTTFTYDSVPKLRQPRTVTNGAVTNGVSEITQLEYDARGNVLRTTDPLGAVTESTYNLADQALSATAPTSLANLAYTNRYETEYAFMGGPAKWQATRTENNTSGVLARLTTFTYDGELNPLSQTGTGEDASITYNSFYGRKTFKDGANNSTRYSYDLDGRPTLVQYPGTTATSGADTLRYTSYNLNGDVLQTIDGRGTTRNFYYDLVDHSLNNVTGGAAFSLTRDPVRGYVTSITDDSGTQSTTRDDLGNTLTATTSYSGMAPVTFSYQYHPDGSRKKMTNPGGVWDYNYDKAGRYTSMNSPLGMVQSSYFADGRQKRRILPCLAYTDYNYDANGLLTTLVNKQNASTTLSSFSMDTYDNVRNLKTWSQSGQPPGAGPSGAQFVGSTVYEREADGSGTPKKDRLTKESGNRFTSGSTWWNEANAYDNSDNATTFRNSTRTFNSNNQLTNSGYAYDGNGNPTTYGGKTAVYDAGNRLTQFPNSASGNMKMGYRADGLRAWTIASSTTTGGITAETEKVYQYYDGGNSVLEKGASGILSVNVFAPDGLVARSYTPPDGGGLSEDEGVDILLGMPYVGEYMFDWQGNATHILSPNQVQEIGQPTSYTLIHSAYNAWGQKRFLYPTDVNMELHRFGYNARWGYRTDTETGLVYCQNRYYDPANGRWVTRDPIGYAGGVNLYGYCGSGPVGMMDSTGLLTIAGNTSGIANAAWISPGNWPSHTGLTKLEVIMMIIETDDDSVAIWGHGWDAQLQVGNGEYLTPADIRFIAKQRKKRGKKKFSSFEVNECYVMNDPDMINAILELSEEVTGFEGLTGFSPRKSWRKPVTGAPGSATIPHDDANLPAWLAKKKKSPGRPTAKRQ